MSKEYGNPCATYIIPLNNDDDNDVFRTGCKHLYHFLHCKSAEYKPLMLKMHLEFIDSPPMTVAEGKNIEQQLEEDALQQSKDNGNQLMDRIDKLEKDNSLDYERLNALLSSSGNATTQSVQQLEAKIKTLEDALLQTKSDGNKLIESIKALDESIAVDETPDGGNNITQDPNANNKQTHNVSNLSVEQHNDTENENVASASDENHTCTVSEEKQEVLDLRRNCVLILRPLLSTSRLDQPISYVYELAKEMNAQIADNSVIHIDMDDNSKWYVYFRDADSKYRFLKNRFIFEYNLYTQGYLRIFDFSNYGIVDIHDFKLTDMNLDTAIVDVIGLAKKMGMTNISSSIEHIDMYDNRLNCISYSVRFNREDVKNEFLKKKNDLKKFPETESVTISDGGGHTLRCGDVNNFSMAIASANVIGITELMGLSLSSDNVKRIYVLIAKDIHVSLVVEFSSNDIKNKFLTKYSELKRIENTWISYINISDIKTAGNMVSIEYSEESNYMFTVASFIGLAKQLGFSFTSDQTSRFIQLSQFISNLPS